MDASGPAEGDGIGVGATVGIGVGEAVAVAMADARVVLSAVDGLGDGEDMAVDAPVSSAERCPDSTGPSVTVAMAVATAAKEIRMARRAPARRGWVAAMQRAPYRGASPGTI